MLELKVQFTQGRKADNGNIYLDKDSEIYIHGIKALVLRNMIKLPCEFIKIYQNSSKINCTLAVNGFYVDGKFISENTRLLFEPKK